MNLTKQELASIKDFPKDKHTPEKIISMVDEITDFRIDKDRISIQRLATAIADELFCAHGFNEEAADRLVLELSGGRDGGGWCKEAVVDQIIAKLNDELV